MKRRIIILAVVLLVGLLVAPAEQAKAQGTDIPDNVLELIVLLKAKAERADSPDPMDAVRAINDPTEAIPHDLGVGNPARAEPAVRNRPTGRTAQWVEENHNMPFSRLFRYIVIRYDDRTNIEAAMLALQNNPVVRSVEPNRYMTLSAIPNDPRFGIPGPDPFYFQYGLYIMNFPTAWDISTGHSYVGIIDTGIQANHVDFRAFHEEGGTLVFDKGAFREHLSIDFTAENILGFDCNVDEMEENPPPWNEFDNAGHGSHTAGIIAGRANNGIGTASACWGCSLLVTRAFRSNLTTQATFNDVGSSTSLLASEGSQVINLSAGVVQAPTEPAQTCDNDPKINPKLLCDSISVAKERDIMFVASSGNDRQGIQFPASEESTVAVGGIELLSGNLDYAFWDDAPGCPFSDSDSNCGSNFGPQQDLAAPAKKSVSVAYTTRDHNSKLGCGDGMYFKLFLYPEEDPFGPDDGFGPCTGTSMSAPFVSGLAGICRSLNPLLTSDEILDVMTSTASDADNFTPELGYGVPDAAAAVRRALGVAGGQLLPNRLTPLFCLFSPLAQTHACTTFPQVASALIFDANEPFDTVGPPVPGYDLFPGTGCQDPSNCATDQQPGASVYIFTTDRPPFPGAPPLVPLYRLRNDPNIPNRCTAPTPPRIHNRDFAYATSEADVLHFKRDLGYEFDGIEGYVFQRCQPDCKPAGAEFFYRVRNASINDYAIIPESELGQMQAQGYTLDATLGYVYPATDTDGDGVIDAFEGIIGSDKTVVDTDCDGLSDGDEILVYDMSDPDPARHGYGDPLDGLLPDGRCLAIFFDGFETGDASRWSSSIGGS